MTDQSRLQLTDALIERMLAQRAGPGAPADLIPSDRRGDRVDRPARSRAAGRIVGTRGLANTPGPGAPHLESDPPGRRPSRMAAVVVAAGAGLFVRLSPAFIGGPSSPPSIAPAPSASVAQSSSPAPSPSPVATPRPAAVVAYIKYMPRANAMAPTGRVWIVRTDGTGAHELFPDGTGVQSSVAWSPDGTRLVYTESGALYLTDANGSEPQPLDTGCVASCSDDRACLLARRHEARLRAQLGVIATMDLASGRVTELGSTAPDYNERPRWSPDGNADRLLPPGQVRKRLRGVRRRRGRPEPPPAQLRRAPCPPSRLVAGRLADRLHVPRHQVRQGGRDGHPADLTGRLHGSPRLDRSAPVDDRRELDRSDLDARWSDPVRTGCRGDCAATRGLWTMDADGSNVQLLVPGGSGLDAPLWGIDAAWQPTP